MSVQLVSLPEVRNFLQKPQADEAQDAIISELIEAASQAVITFTEREFVGPSGTTGRQFYYCGDGILNLTPYDLQTVVSVTIDTVNGAGGTALAATEYQLQPKPAKDGVYNWMRLNPATSAPSGRFYEREVTVNGIWGFPAVPDDVKHWTSVTVAEWMRLNVSAFTTTFNIDEQHLERPEMLPSAARAGLARYRMGF